MPDKKNVDPHLRPRFALSYLGLPCWPMFHLSDSTHLQANVTV